MKAFVYEKQARHGTFVLRDMPKPTPRAGEVLVRVRAASLNALDYRSVRLGILPKSGVLGADMAGTVEALGDGVRQFAKGDAVLGDLSEYGMGAFAEYARVPENALIRKPPTIAFDQAAALPVAAVTAWQALVKREKVSAGQQVLIYGASGGVGTYAVQFAKLLGAEVTAACSETNIPQALALGASRALDYRAFDPRTEPKRYDRIIAINGSVALTAYLRMLRPKGLLTVVGGKMSQIFRAMLLGPLLSLGSRKVALLAAKPNPADLAQIAGWVAQGRVSPVIDRRYPLAEAAEAMRYLEQEHSSGKVVLTVAEQG